MQLISYLTKLGEGGAEYMLALEDQYFTQGLWYILLKLLKFYPFLVIESKYLTRLLYFQAMVTFKWKSKSYEP